MCESGGLIEAVRLLLGQLSVLNSSQLDAVDTRVSNLLPKLEQTAAKLDSQDPEKDKRINELYEIILRANKESHLLPDVLQRMVALESLHQKGKTLFFRLLYIYIDLQLLHRRDQYIKL